MITALTIELHIYEFREQTAKELKELGIVDKNFLKGDLIRIDISPEALKNLDIRVPTGKEDLICK